MKSFEMVLGGHPDKVCDIIAERIKNKVGGKSAVEVVWFNNKIIVGGEVGSLIDDVKIKTIVKSALEDLGYTENIKVESYLQTQSQEIANIVQDRGAGDNGVFFAGYHNKWSPIISKLKKISMMLTKRARHYGYRTDGKFIANFNESTYGLIDFTLNIANAKGQSEIDVKDFNDFLTTLLTLTFSLNFNLSINPKGRWEQCGGFADSGLTGRKLACDNSLGLFHQGGGAFFGKDVSKADYSVPLYLHRLAKETAARLGLESIELKAHTIIGDKRVKIYHQETLLNVVSFYEIMEYARQNPMSWVGLE